MKTKFTLYYRVVASKHPSTGARVLRPQICDRETYYSEQVIETALERGYIRGQYEDSLGTFRGAMECVKKLGQEGKSVNLGFFRVHPELTGQVDETRELTDANELHVAITALTDLKANASDFNWSRIDDSGVIIKVESVTSPDGNKGEVTRSQVIVANGKNLAFNAAWGDKVTVEYGGLETPITMTPIEKSATYLRFAWPTALDAIPAGTVLRFVFSLHGAEGAAEQPSVQTATLVGAIPPTPALTRINQGSRTAGVAGFGQGAANAITLTGTFPGGKLSTDALKLDLMDGSTVSATMAATSYITASTETSLVLGNGIDNDSEKPDSDWQNKTARFTLVRDGVEYPLSFTFLNA